MVRPGSGTGGRGTGRDPLVWSRRTRQAAAVRIRRAEDADWAAVRALRLEALLDAPLAFASTHAREVGFTEETWRARIAGSALFLAEDAGRVVGTATARAHPDRPDELMLLAMYVAPEWRGRRVAAALTDAVVAEARGRGFRRVSLFVVESNTAAWAAYRRSGFLPTGATLPLPHRTSLTEYELALAL